MQPHWIIEHSFSKVFRLFSHVTHIVLLVLLQDCFKKVGIQFKRNTVLRDKDEEYWNLKVFHPTPEHTVKWSP